MAKTIVINEPDGDRAPFLRGILIQSLVNAGLTPFEALQSGTASAARFFAAENSFGTVQTGLAADLILLGANPLQEITNSKRIYGVMVRGQWLPRADLDRMLQRFER